MIHNNDRNQNQTINYKRSSQLNNITNYECSQNCRSNYYEDTYLPDKHVKFDDQIYDENFRKNQPFYRTEYSNENYPKNFGAMKKAAIEMKLNLANHSTIIIMKIISIKMIVKTIMLGFQRLDTKTKII